MPDQATATDTAQNGWLIEMNDAGVKSALSLSEGRVIGRALGAWSPDRSLALRFARQQDGQDFVKAFLRNEAPFINVVPYAGA
ncbi:hypothetical protein B0G81_6803 [Paraburkholderia sp. BL6665CI2N2]|uniref:hypothetical protein n=1 Tax=Paraburkholderia sp. BL6665CI2N2 TaxID=1938806 RepID=UPI0010664035|nr:hypothetical protein [Paraburkholderia sp. BL6665CI2N2]TDY26293.1 hypothetical protein B0G81_6803 [Paraburkholderia sp. BL6665CI2N2]